MERLLIDLQMRGKLLALLTEKEKEAIVERWKKEHLEDRLKSIDKSITRLQEEKTKLEEAKSESA
jgi:uncharacterized protein YlxW (UPF0749 family)